MHLQIPPMLLALIVAATMFLLEKTLPLPPEFSISFPYRKLFIILLFVVGVTTAGLGVATFRRSRTTVNPTKPSAASTLVVQGIYRVSRNPMYLGVLLILVAWGIYLGNLLVLLLMPTFFVIYMNRFQIGPEERALTELFGDDFSSYMTQVRRWI